MTDAEIKEQELKEKIAGMSLGDAEDAFSLMAQAEIELARVAAKYEAKIADLKVKCDDESKAAQTRCDEAYDLLSRYITLRPELFEDPRKRKTKWGSFGLQAGKPSAEIIDEAKIVEFADRHKLDLYHTEKVIDKAALLAELQKGKVPGAKLIDAVDSIVAKTEKKLLDDAAKKAVERPEPAKA